VALKPLGTIEIFVGDEDRRAGMKANFVVDWAADGPISEPVVEAVMIGTQGGCDILPRQPGPPGADRAARMRPRAQAIRASLPEGDGSG
jgi:Protein of unknown function (DUF3124)